MHTKSIAVGLGKGVKWTSTARGPHKKSDSIPLIRVVRDMLRLADNSREAKRIIHENMVAVDKRVVRDHKFGLGLMDVVELPKVKKHYILLANANGLYPKEIKEADAKKKLCRIIGKTILSKNRVQYNLHDGSNIISDRKHNVGDTLVIELPSRKIVDAVEFKKGSHVIIVHGRHTGIAGVVDEKTEGTATRKSLTRVGNIQTLSEYIFALGKYSTLAE